ncbi:DUF6686 family protein [Olivibacter ginsenosidimutans]
MCNTRILCQTAKVTVSQCTSCGMYFIWHNNILLHFLNQEFYLFLTHIKTYVFEQRAFCFPDGEKRLVMHSSANEISLAFTEEEWEDLKEVLTEAAYLGNVYDILKGCK